MHLIFTQNVLYHFAGEADFIPIETEPSLHQEVENRVKRQVGKVEPSYAYDANDYDYNANDADQYESSGNGYHYDDLEDTYDTEDDEFDPDKVKTSFSLATTEVYYNKDGDRVSNTQWHNCIAWENGRTD